MYPQSAVKNLLKKCQILSPGPPTLHHLHTTRSNLNKKGKIRKWTFGQKYGNLQNKTILMVGETGTGKTTLINTMVNYFLGVKFEDKVWFEITEEEKRDQTESQTSEVTVYEIISEENNTSLTIIDTPGYGDTRGIEKDMDIARNLHELYLHGTGVKDLDAVCLVLKASQNRISDRQRYIFDAVLSLFGKDIEDIIVLCITHSDGGPPTNALQAIRKENVPCCYDDENEPVHFLFNNRQSEEQTPQYEHVFRSACEIGERSLEKFFEFLKSRQRKSITLTVSVLNERMQLKACVESLKERIKFSEAKHNELAGVQKALEQNKEKIEKDENFLFTVTTVYKEKVDITGASWWDQMVTSCGECQQNCHEYNCWVAINAKWCKVMQDNRCTVCGCPDSKHVREGKKYVITKTEEKVTIENLKNKYGSKSGEIVSYDKSLLKCLEREHGKNLEMKKNMIILEIKLKTLLTENEKKKKSLVRDACMSILKLSEIALKPDSAFTIQYLDFLIPRIEEGGTAEWVQKLKDLQRAAAAQESTNPAVELFNPVKNSILRCFSSEKKNICSSKKSTDSPEEYDNAVNREMQNTPPKESADSHEGYENEVNREMQNTPPKESADSHEGYENEVKREMQNTPPKESADSHEGYENEVNREMQNTPPKESADSHEGYENEVKREMQNTPPKESADSHEGYENEVKREMQNTPPKESADSHEGYENEVKREMQNTPPRESADSAMGYGCRMFNDRQQAAPKESTYSAMGYGSRMFNDRQQAAPKESTYSAMGYGSRMFNDRQQAAPKESTYSAMGYGSRMFNDRQQAAPKESTYSAMGYGSRMFNDRQQAAPKESTYSAMGYGSRMFYDRQQAAPKQSTYSAMGYGSRMFNDRQQAAPKESTYSAMGYGSRMFNDRQQAAPKQSTYSAMGYGSRMFNDRQQATPKESADSAMGYGSRMFNDRQQAAPKESADFAMGYGSRMFNDRQQAAPKQSADSAMGYGSRIYNDLLNPEPRESNPSAVGYGSRIYNDLLNPEPRESNPSAVGYGSRIYNDLLNPEPRKSSPSAVGYGSRMYN